MPGKTTWHRSAARADVDVVVELVGGSDGPALACARTTFAAGKGLVTANKAMIAHHGMELAAQAEAARVALRFEAAVAGRHPGDQGTARGRRGQRDQAGLRHPQRHLQLHPLDHGRQRPLVSPKCSPKPRPRATPRPIRLSTSKAPTPRTSSRSSRRSAFGSRIDFASVEASGISRILAADIAQADALGYVIRLIGMAGEDDAGGTRRLFQRVQPHLVPFDIRSPMSTARPTRWWSKAIFPAACCSRARARATARPPARWSPTSSTSRVRR